MLVIVSIVLQLRFRGGVVRHNNDDNIKPDCQVRQPGQALQGPDLAEHETNEGENHLRDNDCSCSVRNVPSYNKRRNSLTAKITVTTRTLGHLGQTLTTTLDQQGHVEEELETLQDVDKNAGPSSIDSESQIAVVFACVSLTYLGMSAQATHCAWDTVWSPGPRTFSTVAFQSYLEVSYIRLFWP